MILRVNANGEKVWEVIASHDRKRRRIRLGTYPDLSLAMARRLASERKAAPSLHVAGMRLADLWEMYEREVSVSRRSFGDVQQVWNKWAAPVIGRVRLDDLTMRHGADLIAHVTRHSSPNRARKVIRYLAPMLSFAAGRGLLPGNPWAGLHLPEGVARRDRVLRGEEWRAVWAWAIEEGYPWGPYIRGLMLSAQRLSDVSEMKWTEMDGDIWTIPASRHKSKKRHEVAMSKSLAELIEAQPRHDEFVFSTRPGKPIVPGTKLRRRIHADTETGDWRFHDLRRTGATLMGEGRVSRFVIERVLGHADHSVTAIYDRALYREEKRRALEVLAATVGGS